MSKGSRSTVRWKHDRIRKKKAREKRIAAAGHNAAAAGAPTQSPAGAGTPASG